MRRIVGSRPRRLRSIALVVPERAERRVDLAESIAGTRLKPTLVSSTLSGSTPALREDRLQVGRLVGDAGGADALAGEVLGARRCRCRERHQRRQRLLHERADRDELRALVAREQQLGLVGDGEVGAAALEQLERRGGVGRRLDLDVEPGALVLARRLGRVDAGVVGVGEVVEHEVEALDLAAARARARPSRRRRRAREREASASRARRVASRAHRQSPPAARAARTRRRARWRARRGGTWRRTRARSRAGRWRSAARGRARRRSPPTRRTRRR